MSIPKIGFAEGTCSRCGKKLRRKRPADLAVCDCYEYCPVCGAKMTPFTSLPMVNWDLLNEPWDSLGDWSKEGNGTSEISPAGQLHQLGGSPYIGRTKVIAGGLPAKYTIETRLKIDVFGGGEQRFVLWDGEHCLAIVITANQLKIVKEGSGFDTFDVSTEEGIFHIWRFLMDSSGHSLKAYRNGNYLHEFNSFYHSTTNDGTTQIETNLNTEMHDDYFKIASGLHPPKPPLLDLTPTTYDPEKGLHVLYVCNNHTPPYYSKQKPVEVCLS